MMERIERTCILGAIAIAAIACREARTTAPPTPTTSPVSQPPAITAGDVRVFANGVPAGTLPLSISVETLGGVSTVLIPRGEALPAERRETFSTATDNQATFEVHVLVGDRTLAADNTTVAKFAIVDIPAAPRGVPMFDVTFRVDEQGTFRLGAKDRGTGKAFRVSLSSALSTPLSQATVGVMLDAAKAEEATGRYGIATTTPADLDSVTVYTKQLRELVASTRIALGAGSKITEADRKVCEQRLHDAERVLEANAQAERSSAKLNALKGDELASVLSSLGAAAKRCR